MERRPLGRTGLSVSAICLGSMTWGQQNTEAEGHAQLDYALERDVDFIDAAEMYPSPPSAETHGRTEQIIGTWLQARSNRADVIVASKVTGPGPRFPYVRDGNLRLDRANILAAVEASLKRLQTDYIDLYQLHWPDRRTNYFGKLGYVHDAQDVSVPLRDTLQALDELVKSGKVRAVGVSNETPWGVMGYLRCADNHGLPRMASIQNAYGLVNRTFEVGLAEVAHREDIGLLAYSPLAGGTLSGKYEGGARPPGARITRYGKIFTRYASARGCDAVSSYVGLARRHDLDPAQMALAFAYHRPFVTSTIIGATSIAQLASNIDAFELKLDDDVRAGIDAIHHDNPSPCP